VKIISGFYLYLVKFIGPKLMSNRKPYDLRWPIRVFNGCMVGFNLWCLWNVLPRTNFGLHIWKCPTGCVKTDPYFIWLGWVFFLSRIAEFLDTIFFVMRKKYRQVFIKIEQKLTLVVTWMKFQFWKRLFKWINSITYFLKGIKSARVSSLISSDRYLDGIQIHSECWECDLSLSELHGSRNYVLLLHISQFWAQNAALFKMEKIHNSCTTGSIRYYNFTLNSRPIHSWLCCWFN